MEIAIYIGSKNPCNNRKKKIVELLKAVKKQTNKKKLLKFGLCPAAGVVTACVDYFEKGQKMYHVNGY